MSAEQFLNNQILELREQRAALAVRVAELEDQLMEAGKAAMKIQEQFEQQAERAAKLSEELELSQSSYRVLGKTEKLLRDHLNEENTRLRKAILTIERDASWRFREGEAGYQYAILARETRESRQAVDPATIGSAGSAGAMQVGHPGGDDSRPAAISTPVQAPSITADEALWRMNNYKDYQAGVPYPGPATTAQVNPAIESCKRHQWRPSIGGGKECGVCGTEVSGEVT